jgi:hypothetical protein
VNSGVPRTFELWDRKAQRNMEADLGSFVLFET